MNSSATGGLPFRPGDGLVECAMAEDLLPIRCPQCNHDQVRLYVGSRSVLTVRCPKCAHTWSLDITALPPEVRAQLGRILRD